MSPRSLLPLVLLPALATASDAQIFRTIDGSGNNLQDPDRGSAGVPLLRKAPAEYFDGQNAPAGAARPSARFVSNALCAESVGVSLNQKGASDMFWQWGQFLDHDLGLTPGGHQGESIDVPVPRGDPWFDPFATGNQVLPMDRSVHVHDAGGVRQQVNLISAYVDGSNVYGSDQARALALRTLDGTGRLRTDVGDMLPRNTLGLANDPTPFDPTMFLAGDVRSSEQSGLAAMHTLWVREHNTVASYWRAIFPTAPGDLVYELARAIVVAELQHVTYTEFLPLLLGPNAMPAYTGYDPTVDAGIANEFSTVGYRFGHSMLSSELMRMDSSMVPMPAGPLELRDAFFNPTMLTHPTFGGVEAVLRGLSMQQARAVDLRVVDDVRNFLFGPPGAGGLDLCALNVNRGRDHGVADYATLRGAYGLSVPTSFNDVPTDVATRQVLSLVYWNVSNVDPWIGAISETPLPDALVGELLSAILVDQFTRLRDGDRYWYERYLPGEYLAFVRSQRLCDVVRRNTSIGSELANDVFRRP